MTLTPHATIPRSTGPLPPAGTARGLIPAIGYIRVSTWREEKISNQIQKAVIEEAAARRGRYIALWIEDLDESGRHFKRKVMQAIEAVEGGTAAEIWVWKFSRFGRSRYGVAINLARVEQVGGQLMSATEAIDATTATGRFTRGMLFEVAAFESDRAGEQWKETHQLRRNLGLPATGGKRFGYRRHPRRIPDGEGGWTIQEERYEVLPAPAEIVVDSWQQYNTGRIGYGTVARWWNGAGWTNTRGAPWQDQAVRWYMDSGFAAGLLILHNPDAQCGNPGRCQKKDHYHYAPAEHEAIITGDEWDTYRDRRATRAATPRRALSPVYPLAGLIRCGLCRGAATIHQCKGIRGYAYRCGPRARGAVDHEAVWIRRALVEDQVLAWLHDVRDEIDAIAAGTIVTPTPEPAPDATKQRRRLTRHVREADAALDRATDGYVRGRIPEDAYLRTRDRLQAERDRLQAGLDALTPAPPPRPDPATHREPVRGLLAEWTTIAVQDKRLTLAKLIRRVELHPDDAVEVVPVWAPPDPPPSASA